MFFFFFFNETNLTKDLPSLLQLIRDTQKVNYIQTPGGASWRPSFGTILLESSLNVVYLQNRQELNIKKKIPERFSSVFSMRKLPGQNPYCSAGSA